MTDDELVEHYFPARWFPYAQREVAKALASAVREAVLASVRACHTCVNGVRHRHDCPTCHGRGVVEGET